jgi:hypothetical protein
MTKFLQTTNRTVAWFKKTNDNGELHMKPPFQRNPVWTHPQKSFLIDSLLNGYPIPELYMQEAVDEEGNEEHIVIDGQQRIRACLEFIEGNFFIREQDSPSWGGMYFEELSAGDKKKIFGYTFIVRTLPVMSDEDIRGIFLRLNKNVVALNAQELRQATYWGPFIETMQEISNWAYWSTTGIFTPQNVRRMLDVEFISELSVAVLHGHQNKKQTLDKYYQEYEEEFESRDELLTIFQKVITEMENLFPDIKNTRWKKKTDFYSLFIYFSYNVQALPFSQECRLETRKRLDDFANSVNEFLMLGEEKADVNEKVREYGRSIRASTDLANRKRRHEALRQLLDDIVVSENDESSYDIKPLKEGLFNEFNNDEVD